MPVVSAELLLMLMPLAAVIAILLGLQQQHLADARRDSLDTHRAVLTLEAAFAHVPVGLAVLDLDLRYVRINRLLADINGLPVEDHIGKSIHDAIPEIAPPPNCASARSCRPGRPSSAPYSKARRRPSRICAACGAKACTPSTTATAHCWA